MRKGDARMWTAPALLAGALGGCGGANGAEQAAERSETSAGDTALFPGAEEPGPQFDND